YQKALSEGADFVIGPLTKEDVQALNRSGSFSVPTLALNYTDISWGSLPTNFYEFGLLPEDEVTQMVTRARSSGSHAIIIAPNTTWGKRLVSAFSNRWQSAGGSIQDTWYYAANTNFNQDIAHLLNVNPDTDSAQRRHDFDVIFLFAQPQEAHLIVPLLRYYYANNVPIYATSSVYSGTPNPAKDMDLNGVIVCDTPSSRQAAQGGASSNRLSAVGQDAYLLSQTLPRLSELPNFPMYGATGALILSSNHQIHRHVPCTMIQNGLL
ncbi:MAG: penicillin-binding protein activator, partial [Gammaproteobacteria bacterium]